MTRISLGVILVGVLLCSLASADDCKSKFDPQKFCEQLIQQDEFAVEGGYKVHTSRCRESTGSTSASMVVFQDGGKNVLKIQCELHCGVNKAHNTIRAAEVQTDPPWSTDSEALLKKYDACTTSDYSKLIEAYQKQMGEEYSANK